jgi:hypothetical protein
MPSMYLGESKVWHELRATSCHVIPWIKQNHEAGGDVVQWSWHQCEFQDPKIEVLQHIRPYFVGIFPYIGLIFPLMTVLKMVLALRTVVSTVAVAGAFDLSQWEHWKGPKLVCKQQVDKDLPKPHLKDNWLVVSNMIFIFHFMNG